MLRVRISIEVHERPVSGPVYDDAYIEHWGEVYLAHPQIRERGVLFVTFLAHPVAVLRAINHSALRLTDCTRRVGERDPRLDETFYALAEAAIRQLEREGASCANGRFVERLKHRMWPRSRRSFAPQEQR